MNGISRILVKIFTGQVPYQLGDVLSEEVTCLKLECLYFEKYQQQLFQLQSLGAGLSVCWSKQMLFENVLALQMDSSFSEIIYRSLHSLLLKRLCLKFSNLVYCNQPARMHGKSLAYRVHKGAINVTFNSCKQRKQWGGKLKKMMLFYQAMLVNTGFLCMWNVHQESGELASPYLP